MKFFLFTIVLLASAQSMADELERVAVRYYEFLFFEDQVKENASAKLTGDVKVSSFYSKDGHRMIIASSLLSNGKSYYALLSVNELNMGFLAWKQRGFGSDPDEDIRLFMRNDGEDFNFEGW